MDSRAVVVDGALNVRDLGGLRAADGRVVRPRRVLRSDSLARLSEQGVATLVDEVGVRLVIDLRAADEVGVDGRGVLEEHPVGYVNLPLRASGALKRTVVPESDGFDLLTLYSAYVDTGAPALIEVLTRIADPTNIPVVVHCTVGKDRTGVVVALLLDALGVDRDDIIADYAETERNMTAVIERLRTSELFRAVGIDTLPAHVLSADPETMRRFLEHMQAAYGGVEGWLQANGAGSGLVDALRSTLLDEATPGGTAR